jgi:hypothetical protein
MRHYILLYLTFVSINVYAQLVTPMFQTTFYFEDAVGNHDTIYFGADTTASYEYDPEFGEYNLISGFDSVFEVRAMNGFAFRWGPQILTKTIVGGGEYYSNFPECYNSDWAIFFIHAKNWPVTITWDRSYMDNQCNIASFLTPDLGWELLDPSIWMVENPIRYACASKSESYTLTLGAENKPWFEFPYIIQHKIEGSQNSVDSIYGVCFSGFTAHWYYSPCSLTDSDEPLPNTASSRYKVIPNPVASMFYIEQLSGPSDIELYTNTGALVKTMFAHDPASPVDVGDLPSGIYFVRIRGKDGQPSVSKFVKM